MDTSSKQDSAQPYHKNAGMKSKNFQLFALFQFEDQLKFQTFMEVSTSKHQHQKWDALLV